MGRIVHVSLLASTPKQWQNPRKSAWTFRKWRHHLWQTSDLINTWWWNLGWQRGCFGSKEAQVWHPVFKIDNMLAFLTVKMKICFSLHSLFHSLCHWQRKSFCLSCVNARKIAAFCFCFMMWMRQSLVPAWEHLQFWKSEGSRNQNFSDLAWFLAFSMPVKACHKINNSGSWAVVVEIDQNQFSGKFERVVATKEHIADHHSQMIWRPLLQNQEQIWVISQCTFKS